MSRACLGKMMHFRYKWPEKWRFFTQKLKRSSRPPHHCVASMLNETGRSFARDRESIPRIPSRSFVSLTPVFSTENWLDMQSRRRPSGLLVTPLRFARVEVIAACVVPPPPTAFKPARLGQVAGSVSASQCQRSDSQRRRQSCGRAAGAAAAGEAAGSVHMYCGRSSSAATATLSAHASAARHRIILTVGSQTFLPPLSPIRYARFTICSFLVRECMRNRKGRRQAGLERVRMVRGLRPRSSGSARRSAT